jgi:Calx-beta domain/FG-GAP-like repeat
MMCLMKFPLLSIRVLFLVLVLVSAHVAVYAVDCPTCQTSFGATHTLLTQNPTGFIEESAIGDFNGDSNLDLVAVTDKSQIVFLPGDGTGNFGAPVFSVLGVSSFRRSLTVGEFNGDDRLDLAVAVFSSNQVIVLLGNGAGAFSLNGSLDTSLGSPGATERIVVTDFNSDDKQDLLVLKRAFCVSGSNVCFANRVFQFSGNGAGDFTPAGSFPSGAPGFHTNSGLPFLDFAAADFNGDGKIDLALLGSTSTENEVANPVQFLTLRFGDGNGNFGAPITLPERQDHFTVGDFNGDGKPDLAGSYLDRIRVYLADGQGGFTTVDNPNYEPTNTMLSAADFNMDGKLDLLVNNNGSNFTGYAPIGDGQGRFQLPAPIRVGTHGSFLTTGDFNEDGKPDLVVAHGDLDVMLNQTDCSQPVACIAETEVAVIEGNAGERTANFTISLSSPSSNAVTIDFATAEFQDPSQASAQSGIDFKAQTGTITFDPSVTSRTFTVSVVGDTIYELDEFFSVVLTGGTEAKAVRLPLSVKPPLVKIVNDDQKPATDPIPHVRISDATVLEGNSGTTLATFVVTLAAPQSDFVKVVCRTADNSAQFPSDYDKIFVPVELTFAPGDTVHTISILVFGDTVPETDEKFLVTLDPNPSLVFERTYGVGTILDDDTAVDPAAPELITEQGTVRALALDALLHTTGPFAAINNNYFVSDKQTRITLFARNLSFSAGEDPLTALQVLMRDVDPNANPTTHEATVEFVGPLAGADGITQIILKLPEDFTLVGDKLVSLSLHNLTSKNAVIGLKSTVSATN